jgi:NDP-sugar pyrophosphorylase family protein
MLSPLGRRSAGRPTRGAPSRLLGPTTSSTPPGCQEVTLACIGIVPAAGFATRAQPLPCSKEVYPVRGRPLMDHLLERLERALCDEIRVVTRPEKEDVVRHAAARGGTVVVAHPATLGDSVRAGLVGIGPGNVVLVGFPDSIWDPIDGFLRLRARLDAGAGIALGLFKTPHPQRSAVVTLAQSGHVMAVELHPNRPVSDLVWGCLAARAEVLAGMPAGDDPSLFLGRLALVEPIAAEIFGQYVDFGTHEALHQGSASV